MPKTPKSKPPPPPISQRRMRARSRSRSRSRSKSPPEIVSYGPGELFTERPSKLYCIEGRLDEKRGEKYNHEIHFSGKYKMDKKGLVFDENGNLIENTLEEGIRARCEGPYGSKQIKQMIDEAKGKTPSPMTRKRRESLKLESLGGRRHNRKTSRRRSNHK